MYNDIDSLGLTFIAEAELNYPDYSFDLVGAWKNADGGIFLGTDSGCSCPTPWENHGVADDFTGPLTKDQAVEEATSIWRSSGEYEPEEFAKFIEQVRAA